jgi:NADPH-dependent 2,4-dienoyl-CoA reductase/sulfur reductase-like enzyme
MEAARVAALRGHRVTLCEREAQLGGTLLFSSLLYPPNGELVRYQERQLDRLGVDVQLGREVTPELLESLRPDATIVAVGAAHERPSLPGADQRHVLSGDDLRALLLGDRGTARRKLRPLQRLLLALYRLMPGLRRPERLRLLSRLWLPIGRRVAVVGGGLVGVELAEFLAERGRTVTVIERSPWLAPEMAIPRRWRILHELREHGVTLLTGHTVLSIESDRVRAVAGGGEPFEVLADHVILAEGVVPDPAAIGRLAARRPVWTIGDCQEVGYIEGAIASGHRAGLEV